MVVDYSQPPKMVHFNGANPLDWVSQVERYFFCHSVSDSFKLPLASFFIEGEAREWFCNNQFRDWDKFVDQFLDRYRNWSREEPDKRLAALEEKNSNADHMFAEIAVTTASLQIHDPNTCVTDGGISATTRDKVFEESSSDSEVLENEEEIPFLLAPNSSDVAMSLKDERDAKVVAASLISSDMVDGISGPADNSKAPLERSEILIGNSLNLIPLTSLMVSIDCIKTVDNSLGVKYDEVESSQNKAAKVFATSPQLRETSFLGDQHFRDCAMMRIFVSLFQSRKFRGIVDTTGRHKDLTRPIHGIEANTVQLWQPRPLPKPPFLALLFDSLEQVRHSFDLQKRLEQWPLIWQYCYYDPLSFSRIHGVFRVENSWNDMGFWPNSFSYFNQLKVKISSLEFSKHVLMLVPIRFHPLDINQFLVLVRYWFDTGQRLEASKFSLTLFPRSSRELIVGVAKHVHISKNILDTHADAELLIGRGIIRCFHLGKNVKICYTTFILRDMVTLVMVIADALATDQLALMSVKRKYVYSVNMLLLLFQGSHIVFAFPYVASFLWMVPNCYRLFCWPIRHSVSLMSYGSQLVHFAALKAYCYRHTTVILAIALSTIIHTSIGGVSRAMHLASSIAISMSASYFFHHEAQFLRIVLRIAARERRHFLSSKACDAAEEMFLVLLKQNFEWLLLVFIHVNKEADSFQSVNEYWRKVLLFPTNFGESVEALTERIIQDRLLTACAKPPMKTKALLLDYAMQLKEQTTVYDRTRNIARMLPKPLIDYVCEVLTTQDALQQSYLDKMIRKFKVPKPKIKDHVSNQVTHNVEIDTLKVIADISTECLASNLEDKVLIKDGRIVMNSLKDIDGTLLIYVWDPGGGELCKLGVLGYWGISYYIYLGLCQLKD